MPDETLFPASERTPGQASSRRAYREIQEQLSQYPWWQDYQALRAEGWDWRKAVYIAWEASPGVDRQPPTQHELATQVLGLASDRVIRQWKEKHEELERAIVLMAAAPLLKHRRDIYEALAQVARDPDPKSHADRKLALEMLGDYKPKAALEHSGLLTFTADEAAQAQNELDEWNQQNSEGKKSSGSNAPTASPTG